MLVRALTLLCSSSPLFLLTSRCDSLACSRGGRSGRVRPFVTTVPSCNSVRSTSAVLARGPSSQCGCRCAAGRATDQHGSTRSTITRPDSLQQHKRRSVPSMPIEDLGAAALCACRSRTQLCTHSRAATQPCRRSLQLHAQHSLCVSATQRALVERHRVSLLCLRRRSSQSTPERV